MRISDSDDKTSASECTERVLRACKHSKDSCIEASPLVPRGIPQRLLLANRGLIVHPRKLGRRWKRASHSLPIGSGRADRFASSCRCGCISNKPRCLVGVLGESFVQEAERAMRVHVEQRGPTSLFSDPQLQRSLGRQMARELGIHWSLGRP
ncbi:Lamin tail domain-containing protein 2 [Manis javanica]|nr:Lamin tail domain-containing protein 2 [Manis javanica]